MVFLRDRGSVECRCEPLLTYILSVWRISERSTTHHMAAPRIPADGELLPWLQGGGKVCLLREANSKKAKTVNCEKGGYTALQLQCTWRNDDDGDDDDTDDHGGDDDAAYDDSDDHHGPDEDGQICLAVQLPRATTSRR
jgi:hypothetical protein